MSRVPKHSASHAQHAPPLVTKHAPPSCPPAQSSQSFLQPGTGGACRAAGGGGPAARLGQQAADERERGRVVLGAQVQHGQARLDALPQECALLRARPLRRRATPSARPRQRVHPSALMSRKRVCPWLAAYALQPARAHSACSLHTSSCAAGRLARPRRSRAGARARACARGWQREHARAARFLQASSMPCCKHRHAGGPEPVLVQTQAALPICVMPRCATPQAACFWGLASSIRWRPVHQDALRARQLPTGAPLGLC